jgi:hypothetical protein
MPESTPAPTVPDALATTTQQVGLSVLQEIIQTIPTADEDPTERMAAFILTHPAEEWDTLFAGLPSIRDYVGREITVNAIRVRESDFEGPVGIYLILDAVDVQTGKAELISCSSQMSMVQLLALYRDKKLPVRVEVVQKDKPTKAGFRPIHLRYVGSVDASLGDPGAVVSEQ